MTDLFDQQITESMHHSAAHASARPGSFSDVRRRVRVRRQRHVAAAVLPAVAGMAWLGMRPTTTPSGWAAAPGASDSVPVSSEPTAETAVTSSTEVTPTTVVGVSSTIPADLVAHVLCIDATGQNGGSSPSCTEYLPNVQRAAAPTSLMGLGNAAFVVPADQAYQSEAETVAASLGLQVLPDMLSYLGNDLADLDTSNAHVFLVLSGDTTTCTVPGCTEAPPETAVPGPELDARIAEWVDRAGIALAPLGFPTIEHKTDQDGVTKISASDPNRPTERNITITILPSKPQVTPTTSSYNDQDGSAAVKYQANDGWIYEIEVVDNGGGTVPTADDLLQIVIALGR